jgi:hypothetical protein
MNARRKASRLGALVATLALSSFAEARPLRKMSSLSTQNDAAERKLGRRAAEYDGSLFDAEVAGPLGATSSFPLRLVFGAPRADSWDKLPPAALQPKGLKRTFSARSCEFTLTADIFEVRQMKAHDGQFSIVNDMLGPQSVVTVLPSAPAQYVTLVTSLGVKMTPGTEAQCRKLFASKKKKKARFASVALEGGKVYAENRGGVRLAAGTVTESQVVDVYLTWNERKKTLRVTDRAGLPVSLESGVQSIPTASEGIYYLAYEPSWTIEQAIGYLAAN